MTTKHKHCLSDSSKPVWLFNTYEESVETMVDDVIGRYVFAIVGLIGAIVVTGTWTLLQNNRAPLIDWRGKPW